MDYFETKEKLNNAGYILKTKQEDFDFSREIVCVDKYGYKYRKKYERYFDKKAMFVSTRNPYSIRNINQYLRNRSCECVCVSRKYEGRTSPLLFMCNRCYAEIYSTWHNVFKEDKIDVRNAVYCPNCDGVVESLGASILKQMFLHKCPGTKIEDRSFINPETNCVSPTDIVNHEMKVAIEVQSHWHDDKTKGCCDDLKRMFWERRGYDFYGPDIRDYSVLELCQLFFDIKEIPDYIDYSIHQKINIKDIQKLLNGGMKVKEIAKLKNVDAHRIYDAIYSGKLYYPDNYDYSNWSAVIQFDDDWNYLDQYVSYAEAERVTGVLSGNISSTILTGKSYRSCGYRWLKKKDYVALLKYLCLLQESSETAVA